MNKSGKIRRGLIQTAIASAVTVSYVRASPIYSSIIPYLLNDEAGIDIKTWLDSVGLIWLNSIEPVKSGINSSLGHGQRIWCVDVSRVNNGDGSFLFPFNNLDWLGSTNIQGDHIWLAGSIEPKHSNYSDLGILDLRTAHGGVGDIPTVIKSWPGRPRAKLDGKSNDLYPYWSPGSYTPGQRVTKADATGIINRGINFECINATSDEASISSDDWKQLSKSPIYCRGDSFLKPVGKIIFQNLEITGGPNTGVSLDEHTQSFDFVSCEIHNNPRVNRSSSSTGGIVARMEADLQAINVTRCKLYKNNVTQEGIFLSGSAADNTGDVVVLSNETNGEFRKKITIWLNEFVNGYHGITHKGSGIFEGEYFNNLFVNLNNPLKQRGVRYGQNNGVQTFRHNLVDVTGFVCSLDPRNQLSGTCQLDLHNNTIIRCSRLVGQHGTDKRAQDWSPTINYNNSAFQVVKRLGRFYKSLKNNNLNNPPELSPSFWQLKQLNRVVNIYNNIVLNSTEDNFIIDNFESEQGDTYTENNNIYSKVSSNDAFVNWNGVDYTFMQMQAGVIPNFISNSSSLSGVSQNQLLFVNADDGDFRLKAGSPAIGSGVEKSNIGAFPVLV